MIRTIVAALGCWPEGVSVLQARTIPEAIAYFTTVPVMVFTWHFEEGAGQCITALIEEGACCLRIFTEIKATIGFYFQHATDLTGKARTHCMDIPCWLRGWEAVWPHHSALPCIGHRSLTLTMMLLGSGGLDGEYGSAFEVILKQRPQASPAELPAPNANWLTAAEKPANLWPHAVKGRRGQRGLHEVRNCENRRSAYRECCSQNTA